MIRFDNVTKDYDGTTAVNGLDLSVEDGELFVFLGPNGAGKSTSIKMCATLLQPTSGRVLVDGRDVVTDSLEVRHHIGYLPETPSCTKASAPARCCRSSARRGRWTRDVCTAGRRS